MDGAKNHERGLPQTEGKGGRKVEKMPTLNSKTLTARVRSEDLDKLEPILERETFSEWVREQLNGGRTGAFREIESMIPFFHISLDEFVEKLAKALNDGVISVENGEIVTEDSIDLSRFYEVCHERGIEPQKAMDKAVNMLWNG